MARESRIKTCPHSVHSLRAVSSLLMVGVSRSVKAVARNRINRSLWSTLTSRLQKTLNSCPHSSSNRRYLGRRYENYMHMQILILIKLASYMQKLVALQI